MTESVSRCGFVALVGPPNAGKSTLLNTLVGTKVAIVTPKVQTTRTRVLGIVIEGGSQIVFVDTPGIFLPKRRLERAMVATAWREASEADETVLLVDAARPVLGEETGRIVEQLRDRGRPSILALNKVDAAKRAQLLTFAAALDRAGQFSDVFMISGLTGDGVADLRRALAERLPEGPWLFPEDEITDMPMRLMAAEITREQLFLRLQQELPYAATVETEAWEPFEDGSLRVAQVVYVQRDSQKAIVLGRRGQMIKTIGSAARQELEGILDCRIHLSLFVKVRANWIDDPARYRDWGLDYNA